MSVSSLYYLNGSTLSSSTAVFTDSSMVTCAPDGWYSDGSVSRQQVDCVLLAQQVCNCEYACPSSKSRQAPPDNQAKGIFEFSYNSGNDDTSTGAIAILIDINPGNIIGVKAVLNSVVYSSVVSANWGYLSTTSGDITFLGNNTESVCSVVSSGGWSYSLHEFSSDAPGFFFTDTGLTTDFNLTSAQTMALVPGPMDTAVMIIPKTAPTPNDLKVYLYALCPNNSEPPQQPYRFGIEAHCPTGLPTFSSTIRFEPGEGSIGPICAASLTQTYYFFQIHSSVNPSEVGLYDYVFSDINGANPLPNGWYRTPATTTSFDIIEVENGIVIGMLAYCF